MFFCGAPLRPVTRKSACPFPPRVETTPTAEAREFFQSVFSRVNLPVERYRANALMRRVPACLRHLRVRTLGEAKERIEQRPALALELMDVVLLGVSEFRRDPAVFTALRSTVIPRLLAGNAHPRIWSAACSEGQELYSVAGLLAECGALESCELRGTDCRPEAIARARAGEYPIASVAHLEAEERKGLFVAGPDCVRIHPRLRTAVTWRVANLLAQCETGPWDLILWRNMAIYLEIAAAEEVWRRLVAQLAPGGFIVVGKADYPPPAVGLERIIPSVYQKPL